MKKKTNHEYSEGKKKNERDINRASNKKQSTAMKSSKAALRGAKLPKIGKRVD